MFDSLHGFRYARWINIMNNKRKLNERVNATSEKNSSSANVISFGSRHCKTKCFWKKVTINSRCLQRTIYYLHNKYRNTFPCNLQVAKKKNSIDEQGTNHTTRTFVAMRSVDNRVLCDKPKNMDIASRKEHTSPFMNRFLCIEDQENLFISVCLFLLHPTVFDNCSGFFCHSFFPAIETRKKEHILIQCVCPEKGESIRSFENKTFA